VIEPPYYDDEIRQMAASDAISAKWVGVERANQEFAV
jgi:hypothetical protein